MSRSREVPLLRATRARAVWRTALVALLFTGLTIWMTWPLAVHLGDAVVGWVGDNYVYVWMIGWYQKALIELHQSPLSVPILNHPEGFDLAYTDIPQAMVYIGLPVSLLFNPTAGYNFSIIVSFVLSGLGAYIWVRRLTRSSAAGVICGAAFAFAPYRMSHLYGHLNLMGTQWLPFYFMGLGDLLSARQWSRRSVGLTSVSLGLIGFTSQYYLYMTLLISVAYVVGYVLLTDRASIRRPVYRKHVSALAAIALPLVLLSARPYLRLASRSDLSHSFENVEIWSASPTDFVLPSPRHWFLGDWVAENFPRELPIEHVLYVGGGTLALAGLAVAKVRGTGRYRGVKRLLVSSCVVAFVLALGTNLNWLGESVIVDVPGFAQRWHPHPRTHVLLPGYLLYRFFPYYASMRVWMRYGIFVQLFLTVLAGMGIGWLLRRAGRGLVPLVSALVLMAVMADSHVGMQRLSPVTIRPVDQWLSLQPGNGGVAQFPFLLAKSSRIALSTLFHEKPFISDPFGTFNTPQHQRIGPTLSTFPSRQSAELLRELGVQWVIVDSSRYPDFEQVHQAAESLGLRFTAAVEGQYVYELR